MAATIPITVTNSGANIVLDGTNFLDNTTIEIYAASGVTLTNDWHLEINPQPANGVTIHFNITLNSVFDLNGNTFDIEGQDFTQTMIDAYGIFVGRMFFDSSFIGGVYFWSDFAFGGYTDGSHLLNESVTLAKIEDLARGNIIVGNSTNRPTAVDFNNSGYIGIGDGTDYNSVAQSGDVIFSTAGVSAIQAGVIVNADVNASAAIARTKLASGTADYVVINSGTGAMSQEAQLATSRGGTGLDTSTDTGFATVNSGTWSIGSIKESIIIPVSFEAGEQCSNNFKIYYDGTITAAFAYVTKAIAATDNATVTIGINGLACTDGIITLTASSALNAGFGATPSALNTFTSTSVINVTSAKVTAGGKALVTLIVERNS